MGSVLLAEGHAREALSELRSAWMSWQELEAPYEGARVRVLLALSSRSLGDPDTEQLELDAARRVFERLGAAPDLARVNKLLGTSAAPIGTALTSRELEVIRLVARGESNRAIARQLVISERTVDRHVSNILRKLDLSSRSAATAYAYAHGLVI
jgi:DNA-binding NarL/FixJ family response regulator